MTFEAQCGETRFPEICPDCREPKRVMGPRKRRWTQCGCQPEAPGRDRSMKPRSTRRTGDKLERAVLRHGIRTGAQMLAQPASGQVGSRDGSISKTGDFRVRVGGSEFRGEAKFRSGSAGFKTLERWLGPSDFLVTQGEGRRLYTLTEEMFGALTGRELETPTGAEPEGRASQGVGNEG